MRTLEIRVSQASLADILNEIREWHDRKKCALSHFRHTSDEDGSIVISAGFATAEDHHIDAFHRRFASAG
jgi:hypothetical protein